MEETVYEKLKIPVAAAAIPFQGCRNPVLEVRTFCHHVGEDQIPCENQQERKDQYNPFGPFAGGPQVLPQQPNYTDKRNPDGAAFHAQNDKH